MMTSFELFLTASFFQGIAAGAIPSTAIPYMADITPSEKIGKIMGIALSGTVAGTVVGRSISGIIAQLVNWQFTYIFYSILLALIFVILLFLPSESNTKSNTSGLNAIKNTFKLFGNTKIVQLLLTGFLLFFAYLGSATFLTPYLSKSPFYCDAGIIGLLGLAGITGILVSPVAGSFVSKYGSYKIMIVGISIVTISIQIMGYIYNIPVVFIGLALMYTGVFICQPAIMSIVNTSVEQNKRGGASALYLLSCLLGWGLGAFVLKFVFNSFGWIGIIEFASFIAILSLLNAILFTYGNVKTLKINKL